MLRAVSIATTGFRRVAASTSRLESNTASTSRSSRRFKSTLKVINAASDAPREVPTPLLFLTASKWTWSPPAADAFSEWIKHFSQQGFRSLLLDLDPDQPIADFRDSAALMELFENDAIDTLRQAGETPFLPPIMITKGPAALIAQTYVSSRPLTALQLIDPPISNQYLRKDRPELLPNDLAEFNFEATFPLRVLWSQAELQRQQDNSVPWYHVHRIEHEREEEADESLDRYTYVSEKQGAETTQEWLEGQVGVLEECTSSMAEDDVGLFEEAEEEDDGLFHTNVADSRAVDTTSSNQSATPSSPTSKGSELELPEWFTAGSYTLQPGSRKYPLTLDEKDLAEKFIRGSGPGGQAINKLSTNVQLSHIPTGTKVTCQETRSRDRNRELARRRLSLTLEKLLRGERGGSRIDRQIEKERRKKINKKKKQKKRQKEKGQADTPVSSTD
ncbi:hypothetical protein NDA11_000939 [Ustilago hordei]|nr:hypothetical protein NDA10_003313 [Ustilago hordei]KAJ1574892.1 hypothetical protein NDA15_000311 [Ustilago hordei]KAJ1593970.1 hypothetical protein NDA12_001344 [Ustilago hordei]KAJ1594686.1 hypothetical protein NDA11_000939 [Ustilago hordei]KAJ1597639.1 hypothetical protein NDA14_006835 [Ustilago hordei]